MTTAAWVDQAITDIVWSIGQLDKATVRELDKLTRKGVLEKGRWLWAGVTPKTYWRGAK